MAGESRSVREVNRMLLTWNNNKKNGEGEEIISQTFSGKSNSKCQSKGAFEAYMEGGIDFGVDIDMGSYGGPDVRNMPSVKGLNLGSVLGTLSNIAGIAPAFDMPRYFSYKGATPMRFSLRCYLKLKESWEKDIRDPIANLCYMALPTKAMSLGEVQGLSQVIDASSQVFKTLLDFLPNTNIDTSNSSLSEQIYLLSIPPSIQLGANQNLKLYIGDHMKIKVEPVVITSMRFSWDRLYIGEGYPERVNIQLGLETQRVVTSNLLSSMFGMPNLNPK